MTKSLPVVGSVLGEQVAGVQRLLDHHRDELRSQALDGAALEEIGRLLLVRLQTFSNRANLKKLPEMMFQMLCGHECFYSHETWTVFCKKLVCLAFKAQRRVEARSKKLPQPADDEFLACDWVDVDEEGLRESDAEQGVTMRAFADPCALVAEAPAEAAGVSRPSRHEDSEQTTTDQEQTAAAVEDVQDGSLGWWCLGAGAIVVGAAAALRPQ